MGTRGDAPRGCGAPRWGAFGTPPQPARTLETQENTRYSASRRTGVPMRKCAKQKANAGIAVAYLRVSTDRQDLSPEAQRAAIEAWGAARTVQIARWFTDRDVSGAAPASQRPALLEAIAAVRELRAGVLVVARRDRLARDVVIARTIARIVERSGASVRSADGVGDGAGPEAALLTGVVDLFAEYERELIAARTKAALAQRRARGQSTGTAPYGFTTPPRSKRLVPEPHEQYVLSQIRALGSRGIGVCAIAAALNRAGFRCRSGAPWCHRTVRNVLSRYGATSQ